MTLTHIDGSPVPAIQVQGDVVTIHGLVVQHPEAADLLRAQIDKSGPEVAADIVRRALPVGLVSLKMSNAALDSGAVSRTLDHFASIIGTRADSAMGELEKVLGNLRQGEVDVVQTANRVLERLPEKVEAALAGQSQSVRAAVVEAARSVQDAGLQQMTAALHQHSTNIQRELSLDREGPLRSLRTDLLLHGENTRKELAAQLNEVRTVLEAAQAAKAAGAKSSRAIGAEVEDDLMARCNQVVTVAGDQFEATGNQAGPNGRRTGDGVATISPLLTGQSRRLRVVFEAKTRSRPMSASAMLAEASAACATREADGALIIVPSRDEVPGETSVCRLDANKWVVSADSEAFEWSYVWLREAVVLSARRVDGEDGIDLTQVEARITTALRAIDDLDDVEKNAYLARRNIDKVITTGKRTQERVREALTDGLAAMRA